jgi:acyl-CoA synthetase (AMP-forming)/AMP-acid ligase II
MLLHTGSRTPRAAAAKVALVCDGRAIPTPPRCHADRLARALQERGVRRGDRVALFLDNTVEMVAGVFAVLRSARCSSGEPAHQEGKSSPTC